MPKDPFLNFISDLSAKIQVSREHKHIMDRVNTPGSVADESKASLENLILTIKEKIEKTVPKDAVEPVVSTEVLPVTSSFVKIVSEEENNFTEFVDKIKNILSKPKIESVKTDAAAVSAAPTLSAHESPADTKKYVTGLDVPKKENIKTKKYVNELEKVKDNIQIEKEDTKVTEIKKLIEEYAEKYIKKAMVMAEYAGGGGTNAVQYVNGGVMNGNLNVNGNYLSAGVNLTDIFALQPDLDKQTLSFNDANYDLSISGGNTVNLSAINTTFNANSSKYESNYTTTNTNSANWSSVYTNVNSNSAYYALTNQDTIFEQDVTIQGNLTALGTSTFQNTVFTTTTALSVVNTGTGPALYVFQAAGPYDVASFYDGDGVEVLHVGNAQGGGNPLGQVGINTSFPSAELTVNGAISSNGVITVLDGNSNQWNSNYTTSKTNSANWSSVYTTVNTNSANYILDGGNTKGANIVVGSNDSFNLNFETNNTNRISILSSGETKFQTKYSLLSAAVPSVEFSSGIIVGTDVASLSSYNTPLGYNIGQFSTNGLLIGQNDVGAYIGSVSVSENAFSVLSSSIGINHTSTFGIPQGNIDTIATSSDGKYVTIASYGLGIYPSIVGGLIYVSHDYGRTFTARINDDTSRRFTGVAMSSDGKVQYACAIGVVTFGLWVSYDYGATWSRTLVISCGGVATSSDGRIVATGRIPGGDGESGIFISNDFGVNWVKVRTADLNEVAMSSDGRIITYIVSNGNIFTSHNYGINFTQRSISTTWSDIDMSADGKNQIAVSQDTTTGGVFVSNDYGVTWTQRISPASRTWNGGCMSSCGRYMFATVYRKTSPFLLAGDIRMSIDYGLTWVSLNVDDVYWQKIKCSSDGRILYSSTYQFSVNGSSFYSSYGQIFTPSSISVTNGNSNQWNSNYTTTNTNSGKWSSVYTAFNANSAKYDSVYTTFNSSSAKYDSVYTSTNANSANWILDGGNTKGSNISMGTNDAYHLNFETNNATRATFLSSGQLGINKLAPTKTIDLSGNFQVEYAEGIAPGVFVGGLFVRYPVTAPKDGRYNGFYGWNSTQNRYVSGTDPATQYYITSAGGWQLRDTFGNRLIASNSNNANTLVPPRFGWVNNKSWDIFDTPPTIQNTDYGVVIKETLSCNAGYFNYIGNNDNFVIERLGLKNLTITDNEGWRGGRTTISNTLCVAPADPTNYFDQPNIFFSDAGLFHATGPRASEEYRNMSFGSNLTTTNGADLAKFSTIGASPFIQLRSDPKAYDTEGPYGSRNGFAICNMESIPPSFNVASMFVFIDTHDQTSSSYGTIKIASNIDSTINVYVPITNARVQIDGNLNVNGLIRTTAAADSLYTGNSNNWNSNYTTTNTNSGKWSSVYTTTNSNSAKYDSNYTSFNSNSAKYDSNWTITNSNSANWTQNRSIQTSNFAASQGSYYIVDTTSAPITGALPASPTIGTTITFQDAFIKWQTNNFTLSTNGNMIQGLNENMICDRGGVMFDVTYIGASIGWRVN